MVEKLGEIMTKIHIPDSSTQVGLKLPKLKKTKDNKSELPKINLPKLKKVKTEGASV